MDPSNLQELAAGNTWTAIWPELSLGCLALLLLVLETLLPRFIHGKIQTFSIAGQVFILAALLLDLHTPYHESFNGLLVQSSAGQAMRVFFLLSSIMVSLLARASLWKHRVSKVEFHHIVLVVSAAMMLLVQSRNFVMLFVSLETVTVGLYILVSYYRSSARTLEAGLKYLVMGSLSSGLLLFGIVLLYGVAGSASLPGRSSDAMQYDELARFLAANPHNFLAAAGIALVLSGVAFKIGAFPFQIWIPDVYQGAPTPVTAFMAAGTKVAAFGGLLRVFYVSFGTARWDWRPMMWGVAILTMVVGSVLAITQTDVKRMLAYSSVAHAGFILTGLVAANRAGLSGAMFYLLAYGFTTLGAFAVVTLVRDADGEATHLSQWRGLGRRSPVIAGCFGFLLFALAGIPLTSGFTGKFAVFQAAVSGGATGLVVVGAIASAIAVFFYARVVVLMFFNEPTVDGPTVAIPGFYTAAVLGLGVAVTLLLGIFPSSVLSLAHSAWPFVYG